MILRAASPIYDAVLSMRVGLGASLTVGGSFYSQLSAQSSTAVLSSGKFLMQISG